MPALQMNMSTGKIFENRPMGRHPLNFGKKIEDKKASREGIKNHPLPTAQGLDLALVKIHNDSQCQPHSKSHLRPGNEIVQMSPAVCGRGLTCPH